MADLGNSIFSEGQSYVALSRVTSLEGLHLINFAPKKVMANSEAIIKYARLKGQRLPAPPKRKIPIHADSVVQNERAA